MSVIITSKAAFKIKEAMEKEVGSIGLKISVKGGGCSGLSYDMNFVQTCDASDKIFEQDDVKIFVDMKSYLFINGMTLDYNETQFQQGFVFNNPNVKATCGCGSSFAV